MPLTPQLKQLFILKKTAMHIRCHKEGERENSNVMVRLGRLLITLTQTLPGMTEMFTSG
jgi:hypothetical protein